MQGWIYDDDEEHVVDKCSYTPCYIVPYTYLTSGERRGDNFVLSKDAPPRSQMIAS
jgi:hypothetical protein